MMPGLIFAPLMAYVDLWKDPNLDGYDFLAVPAVLLWWLLCLIWMGNSMVQYDFLSVYAKQMRMKIFDKLKGGELSPKVFVDENVDIKKVIADIHHVFKVSRLVMYTMTLSVTIALYDFFFSPWACWW